MATDLDTALLNDDQRMTATLTGADIRQVTEGPADKVKTQEIKVRKPTYFVHN